MIKDIGASFSPNLEEIVALRPDVMFIYTFPGDQLPARLDSVGVRYAVDNEWLEETALGRFEWIKFIAAFYDMEVEAEEIFNSIEARISELKSLVAGERAPSVAWFSVYKGTAHVAEGDSYVARALEELGANYVFADLKATGGVPLTLEELVARVKDADVIVYSSTLASMRALLSEVPGLSNSKAFREGRVYAFGESYFQLGYAYTERWYEKLAALLYPRLFEGVELRIFKELSRVLSAPSLSTSLH